MNKTLKLIICLPLALMMLVSCTVSTTPIESESTQVIATDAEKWDLTEYYADDAAAVSELEEIRKTAFPAYTNLTENVADAHELYLVMQARDALSQRIKHVSCYAQQKVSLNAADSDAKTLQNATVLLMQDYALINTALQNDLLSKQAAFWDEVFSSKELAPYWRELEKMRDSAEHALSQEDEKLLSLARQAENNIYDTFATLRYANLPWTYVTDPDGNEVKADRANYARAMENKDREYRKRFYLAYTGAFSSFRDTFAANLNAFTTLSEQLSVKHNYSSTLEVVMDGADLTQEMYDTLIIAGRNGTSVIKREAEIRKAALGLDELFVYDQNIAPGDADAAEYTYAEAQTAIKNALAPFGDEYISVIDKAFNERWVDVYPADGKETGAYSGMACDIHPWVLINFVGDYNSVSTLAHELGHAVHQYWSNASRESVYEKDVPTLASEVASLSNELLLSRYMIENAKDKSEQLYYIQRELELIRNVFFSQISFADFEREFHKRVENGEALTADLLDSLYLENRKAYFPGVTQLEEDSSYWAGVPHFYYEYYVYSYAMALSVACVAADAIYNGDAEMLSNYLEYLNAGNSADAPDLIAMLGVDIANPSYTEPIIARFSELLDMEEALLEE